MRRLIFLLLLICVGCTAEDGGAVLVTVGGPTFTPPPAAPTATLPPTQTPTPLPTSTPVPTTLPIAGGPETIRLLWRLEDSSTPWTLDQSGERLALLGTDGRIQWVDTGTGEVKAGVYLWPSLLDGSTRGQISAERSIAMVLAQGSGTTDSGTAVARSRLSVIDGTGSEVWSLPELLTDRAYSGTQAANTVVVGTWPVGSPENRLAAYTLFTGNLIWERVPAPDDENPVGYRQVVSDGIRVYTLLDDGGQRSVAAYDVQTGDQFWFWFDAAKPRLERLLVDRATLYVVAGNVVAAVDASTGSEIWSASLRTTDIRQIAAWGDTLAVIPAPSEEVGTRPGIIGLEAATGNPRWHVLQGQLADAVAAGNGVLWAVVRDFDEGEVRLVGIDPASGEIVASIVATDDPTIDYRLIVNGRRVYLLGEHLLAFGY